MIISPFSAGWCLCFTDIFPDSGPCNISKAVLAESPAAFLPRASLRGGLLAGSCRFNFCLCLFQRLFQTKRIRALTWWVVRQRFQMLGDERPR